MLKAKNVAKYFLSKDPKRILFNNNVVIYNNRKSYEGNIRLNKYLFLSQVVYMAKYNKRLFADEFCAYQNGPVIEDVMNLYIKLDDNYNEDLFDSNIKEFLDKIHFSLENATYEELIEITHEDPEWKKLSFTTHDAPIMHIEDSIEEYKKRYKGLIEALQL